MSCLGGREEGHGGFRLYLRTLSYALIFFSQSYLGSRIWNTPLKENAVAFLSIRMLGLISLTPAKAHTILDSQEFLLPQRRNRVWGLALLNTGEYDQTFGQKYKDCLASLRSTFQFPLAVNFDEDSPMQHPKAGRHETLVKDAKQSETGDDIYVDCSSSLERCAKAARVLPCVTPSHPVYSTKLQRYMNNRDFMQAQGWWETCFCDDVYAQMLQKLGQDLAGNGFSSTVCQAATLAGMVVGVPSWMTVGAQVQSPQQAANAVAESDEPATQRGVKRRLRQKQAAPAYDPWTPEDNKKVKKKRIWQRKVSGIDSRKRSSGKKDVATLWQKERVNLGFILISAAF